MSGERVAIVGSRDWPDPVAVVLAVENLPTGTVVVSGGARGVDRIAADAARARGLEVVEHLPDWERLGRRAGFVRNCAIVDDCDRVIAFQHERSRGTQHTIDLAERLGKPVQVVTS